MLGQLIPCGGGDPIPLLRPKLLVGRRSQCDIALRFPNVSSHHCELEFQNGYWFIRDLNSRNGIKVNGVECDAKWLMPGDIVSIARHKYEVHYQPQSDTPPPEVEEDPMSRPLLEKAGLVRPPRAPRDHRPPQPSRPSTDSTPATDRPRQHMSEDDQIAADYLEERRRHAERFRRQ